MEANKIPAKESYERASLFHEWRKGFGFFGWRSFSDYYQSYSARLDFTKFLFKKKEIEFIHSEDQNYTVLVWMSTLPYDGQNLKEYLYDAHSFYDFAEWYLNRTHNPKNTKMLSRIVLVSLLVALYLVVTLIINN